MPSRSFAFQVGSSIDDLASNAFGTASSCLSDCLQLRSAPCQLVVQVVSFLGRSATLLLTVALVGLACYGLRQLVNAVLCALPSQSVQRLTSWQGLSRSLSRAVELAHSLLHAVCQHATFI